MTEEPAIHSEASSQQPQSGEQRSANSALESITSAGSSPATSSAADSEGQSATEAAAAAAVGVAAAKTVPRTASVASSASSGRSSLASLSSVKVSTTAAPPSPKRASLAGAQPPSPSKRLSAPDLAAAPRVGAPLPPAPRPASSQAHGGSPKKARMEKGEGGAPQSGHQLQKSSSESDAVAVMADADDPRSSPRAKAAAAADGGGGGGGCVGGSALSSGHSRSASVPNSVGEAAAMAAAASTGSAGPTSPSRCGGAPPLVPRHPQSHPPVLRRQTTPPFGSAAVAAAASSAPPSITSTPIAQHPAAVPAASSSSLAAATGTPVPPPPPVVSAPTSPRSNPISPAASMGAPPPAAPPAGMALVPPLPHLPSGGSGAGGPADGVVLGVEALERQQAELERRRAAAAAEAQAAARAEAERQRALAQAQHLEQLQQQSQMHATAAGGTWTLPGAAGAGTATHHDGRARSASVSAVQAPPSHPLPPFPGGAGARSASTPPAQDRGESGDAMVQEDDDTAPSSTCPPVTGQGQTPRRTSSFGRFLKTPLKQLRHTGSFAANEDPAGGAGASSANKHGSEALVVPPKDVNGILEVEGLWEEDEVKPLIYGYLRKLGRNGQWQKRWFETDGMHLMYYKSRKRQKCLASLDLCHVGAIKVDETDPSACTFTIQVADRPYYLCASSEALCKHWVINLNRVKEARCQVGGFQLVEPHFSHGEGAAGDRQRSESDECTAPRVVMVANRARSRAMAPSETEDAMMQLLQQQSEEKKEDEQPGDEVAAPGLAAVAARSASAPPSLHDYDAGAADIPGVSRDSLQRRNSPRLMSTLPPVVLARWQKRRSNLTRLSMRLLRWARSMRMSKCISGPGEVVMGSPVHPPGRPVGQSHGAYGDSGFSSPPSATHESTASDPSQRGVVGAVGASHSFEGAVGHAEWIDKETQRHIQTQRMHHGDIEVTVDDSGAVGIQSIASIPSAASCGSATASSQPAVGGDGYDSEEETRELS